MRTFLDVIYIFACDFILFFGPLNCAHVVWLFHTCTCKRAQTITYDRASPRQMPPALGPGFLGEELGYFRLTAIAAELGPVLS